MQIPSVLQPVFGRLFQWLKWRELHTPCTNKYKFCIREIAFLQNKEGTQSQSRFWVWFSFESFLKRFTRKMVYPLFFSHTQHITHQTNTKRFNFRLQTEKCSIIIIISIDISTSNERNKEKKPSNVWSTEQKAKMKQSSTNVFDINTYISIHHNAAFFYAVGVLLR